MSEANDTKIRQLSKVQILGDIVEVDEVAVKNRIKIGQRMVAINALLDMGVDPKEIPLPHEFLINRELMAQL